MNRNREIELRARRIRRVAKQIVDTVGPNEEESEWDDHVGETARLIEEFLEREMPRADA